MAEQDDVLFLQGRPQVGIQNLQRRLELFRGVVEEGQAPDPADGHVTGIAAGAAELDDPVADSLGNILCVDRQRAAGAHGHLQFASGDLAELDRQRLQSLERREGGGSVGIGLPLSRRPAGGRREQHRHSDYGRNRPSARVGSRQHLILPCGPVIPNGRF